MIRARAVAERLGRLGAFALVSLVSGSCGQALLTAPVASTMFMSVNPPFIAANGDTAIVSVFILEPAGTPVPDGTVVQFFASLGQIPEQGKTNDGVARVTFRSDARSGVARITAFSGPTTTDPIEVTIGARRPERVIVGLLDPRIDLKTGQTTARFKVTVLDADGNPVSSVPVRFSVTDNPATDTVLDRTDQTTDNNGEASARVQTRRTTAGTIRVRYQILSATALSGDIEISVIE